MKYSEAWDNCLEIIKDNIPESSFRTWFEPIRPVKMTGSTLTIKVPSSYFPEFIEAHFIDILSKTLKRVIGPEAKLVYEVPVVKDATVRYPATKPASHPRHQGHHRQPQPQPQLLLRQPHRG